MREEASDPLLKAIDAADSESDSSFDSNASRVNFWKELHRGQPVGENQILIGASDNKALRGM